MKPVCVAIFFSLGLALPSQGAISFLDADSWWQFNQSTSGPASTAQIVDSSLNRHVVSTTYRTSWNVDPLAQPTLGSGSSIVLRPELVTWVPGAGNSGSHVDNDTVKAAGFIASNASVAGNVSYVMRFRWDGPVAGTDDTLGHSWFVSNGLGGSGKGNMIGVTTAGSLVFFNSGKTYFTSSTLKLNQGEWYDLAIVADDLGDADTETGSVTMYLQDSNGNFRSNVSSNNIWISTEVSSNLIVGGESLSLSGDASNSRKSFNGAIDHLALFQGTLSLSDVQALFAVPEPSRALLVLVGSLGLMGIRRRNERD